MELSMVMTTHATIKPTIPRVSTARNFNKVCIIFGNSKTNFSNNNPRFGQPVKGEIRALLKNSDISVKSQQVELDDMYSGRLVEDGRLFRQNFLIRSFEVGSDRKVCIGNFMNYLQETFLNHCKMVGLFAEGFGRTPHMCERDLVWVVRFMHMEVESYPSWGDVVEVDSWVYPRRNIGHCHNWHIRDSKTNKTLAKATSLYVLINKTTKKLTKLENEIMKEWDPYVMKYDSIIEKIETKLPPANTDEADYVTPNLNPAFKDLDINSHVSHLRYIDYLFQSIPRKVQENYGLTCVTLEYRREANKDNVMQSLTSLIQKNESMDHLLNNKELRMNHSLRLHSGQEIVRAMTEWKFKNTNIIKSANSNSKLYY